MQRHTQGEPCVNMKAENGVMHQYAKEHQRLTASPQKLGESPGIDLSLAPPEGAWHADTLISDF